MLVMPRVREFLRVYVHAERVRVQRVKLFDVRADATTNIQHARVFQYDVPPNQIEAAVLSESPNVGGMAEESRFVFSRHARIVADVLGKCKGSSSK